MLGPSDRRPEKYARSNHCARRRRSVVVGFRFQQSQILPTLSVTQADRDSIAMSVRRQPDAKGQAFLMDKFSPPLGRPCIWGEPLKVHHQDQLAECRQPGHAFQDAPGRSRRCNRVHVPFGPAELKQPHPAHPLFQRVPPGQVSLLARSQTAMMISWPSVRRIVPPAPVKHRLHPCS
jgi:hypothetical protein